MNLIKSITHLFSKKSKLKDSEAQLLADSLPKSVELNVPNSKAKRRKQKRGY
ncbi:hypothetical protein [Deefgea salmonis]|uniref:Uncharacterized protein n=1 Tax=Deefgea salmonis TaxID=2875502 RepID=A0ABS8BH43_9NEIS|nr:hypothetical protein [Deefgea salmonis]MCB5194947.1 hypothetical protein [Deefgea salmonis]